MLSEQDTKQLSSANTPLHHIDILQLDDSVSTTPIQQMATNCACIL